LNITIKDKKDFKVIIKVKTKISNYEKKNISLYIIINYIKQSFNF